jgi:hypothetical protein
MAKGMLQNGLKQKTLLDILETGREKGCVEASSEVEPDGVKEKPAALAEQLNRIFNYAYEGFYFKVSADVWASYQRELAAFRRRSLRMERLLNILMYYSELVREVDFNAERVWFYAGKNPIIMQRGLENGKAHTLPVLTTAKREVIEKVVNDTWTPVHLFFESDLEGLKQDLPGVYQKVVEGKPLSRRELKYAWAFVPERRWKQYFPALRSFGLKAAAYFRKLFK